MAPVTALDMPLDDDCGGEAVLVDPAEEVLVVVVAAQTPVEFPHFWHQVA
jgi:hypothetical protein